MTPARFTARVTGRGTAELPGYGIADAEHRLEKELAAAAPGGHLRIEQVRRTDDRPRIVETFRLDYAVTLDVVVSADSAEAARQAAFAEARRRLTGTRFARIRWERATVGAIS